MENSDAVMKTYYKERAPIYDQVYSYPERQKDLRFLESYIPKQFKGLDVLEVAAGTGYWTQFITAQANSILATDATIGALEQIEKRPLIKPVSTKVIDAYSLYELKQTYTGAFSGLWISHIPKQRLNEFLVNLHRCLELEANVLFIDNSIAQCDRLPLTSSDEFGNTYQDRLLDDGLGNKETHKVLKNFPGETELMEVTSKFGTNFKYIELDNFWLFQYQAN